MSFKIVHSLDEAVWRAFVDRHPSGNIFHTPEMYQVFAGARGHRPQISAALDDSGQVLALLPLVQVSLYKGPLRRLTTRAIAYGGALYTHTPDGREALAALLQENNRRSKYQALFTELRNLSETGPVQPILSEHGYEYEEHLNYLVDLSGSSEQVMENIGSRTRKNIRHALRKANVIMEEIDQVSQIAAWYALVRKTYTAARIPLADISMFESAFKVLAPKGMAKFYLARIDGTCVAATAELPYKDVIYGWYSGLDREYGNEYPGELLMWKILSWGAENGFKTYDFGGAGKPGEASGVRDFKAKFGGQLVCFGRNTKVHSSLLLSWSKAGYDLYRQLRKVFSF